MIDNCGQNLNDMATQGNMVAIGTPQHQKDLLGDMKKMIQEQKDEIAWDAMAKEQTPTRMELDAEILRDLLVDICSATLPEAPPSQEDWDEIRDMVKATAVKHALLTREEKKESGKKPNLSGPRRSVAMPPRHGKSEMISSMLPAMLSSSGLDGSKPLSGHHAELLIIDDVINNSQQVQLRR
jgi:hypothetical protein